MLTRFCVRHLHGNMKVAGFTGKAIRDTLWEAARACTVNGFREAMEKMRKLDAKAYAWLMDRHPSQWSRAYFTTDAHCDTLVNNICESFNKVILYAREQPLLSCLESIRHILMNRFYDNKEAANTWTGPLCPRIAGKVALNEKHAASFMGIRCNEFQFEIKGVFCQTLEKHEVDLENWHCSCRQWDLSGIPCRHAICAIWLKNGKGPIYDYVHPSYKVENYKKAYEGCIMPMAGPAEWPFSDKEPPLPPEYTARPGRPRKLRMKGGGEETSTSKTNKGKSVASKDGVHLSKSFVNKRCGICKKEGHNKRKCPEDPLLQERLVNSFFTNTTLLFKQLLYVFFILFT